MAASLTKTQSYAKPWEVQTSGTAPTVTLVENDYLWIRQTLETTDIDVSPTLSLMEIGSTEASQIFGGTSNVQGIGSIQTAGHKKSAQDSQLELVGSVQVAGHKKSVQDSQLELAGFVQVASRKTAGHDSLFAANSFLQAQRFKASSRGTLLSSQGILEVSGYKNTWTKPEIAGSGLVQTTGYHPVAGEHEVEIAVIGAIIAQGEKSSWLAASLSAQSQTLTAGFTTIQLGIPQNVQAVGISLSEIQLSWDEVLSADGYEYRFREKAL